MDEVIGRAKERLFGIEIRITKAAARFGLLSAAPQLVAVSKTFDANAIRPFLVAGHRLFGENRVQEARDKWPDLKAEFPDVELHLIGPLQTNKARDAVELFDCIQSLDRDRLAGVLRLEMDRAKRTVPVLVQVNIGEEPQKAGIAPREAVAFVHRAREVHGLEVRGLMCIPPDGVPPGPYFAALAMLGREAGTSELSMGMSADFETAIAMGATLVRVGSALFGARG